MDVRRIILDVQRVILEVQRLILDVRGLKLRAIVSAPSESWSVQVLKNAGFACIFMEIYRPGSNFELQEGDKSYGVKHG